MTSPEKIFSWLVRNFNARNVSVTELQMNCPKCKEEKFFFNPFKQKGHCKRASCAYVTGLKGLVSIVGNGPDESGYYVPPSRSLPISRPAIQLPPGLNRLVELNLGSYKVNSHKDSEAIESSRHVTLEDQFKYQFYYDPYRIYIPVYLNGELLSYLGRAKWWLPYAPSPKYLYPNNGKHSKTIFNWDNVKYWNTLTLVENTFNAIWLHKLNVSTNFGSNLSDSQVKQIEQSNVEKIVLIWDEGSLKKAEQARSKLRKIGKSAIICLIAGQPDAYSLEYIETLISRALNAKSGTKLIK